MIFLFTENMILHPRRKMEDDLSQKKPKKHGNMIFSSNFLKRWSFQKRPGQHMIFLVLSGKMVFLPQNLILFPWAESDRRSFSRSKWKYDIFCVHVQMLQTWHHAPLSKKIKDGLIPQKYT